MTNSGIAFIASHLRVDGTLPVEIVPGHIFRAARDNEVSDIRNYLRSSIPQDTFYWVQYEGLVKEERQGTSTTFHLEPLPATHWKYWVVAFEGTNAVVHDLELLGQLLPTAFDIGFVLFYTEPNQGGMISGRQILPLHVVERYSTPAQAHANAETIEAQQLAELGEHYRALTALPEQYAFVSSALKSFLDLRRVPDTSDLIVVGLFSIIESLITHAPRLSETLDSINHQITNKIVLLRKRYRRAIVPSGYFLHAAEDSIWKKLYSYRSSIAHGTRVTFESEFQVLKSRDDVLRFLKDNLKELLRIALHEPEFMFDLRRC